MSRELYILGEDKAWARARIAELDQAIADLGPEFHDVFNQSSETWHDNAPFDALRDRQAVLDAERQRLRQVLRESMPSVPEPPLDRVGIGSKVVLRDKKDNLRTYKVAGDWTPFAGETHDAVTIVSATTPLAVDIIGKPVGAETARGFIVEIVT